MIVHFYNTAERIHLAENECTALLHVPETNGTPVDASVVNHLMTFPFGCFQLKFRPFADFGWYSHPNFGYFTRRRDMRMPIIAEYL